MKLKKLEILFLLIFGLAIILYPFSKVMYSHLRQARLIELYNKRVSLIDSNELSNLKKSLEDYNKQLVSCRTNNLKQDERCRLCLRNYLKRFSNIFGYVEIPKIGLVLPIYSNFYGNRVNEGIRLLKDSSIPFGGKASHSVLCCKSDSLASSVLERLDEVSAGDLIYVSIVGEIHAYEVEETKNVAKADVSNFDFKADSDLLSFLADVPYGVNSQKLIVRSSRIDCGYDGSQNLDGRFFLNVVFSSPYVVFFAAVLCFVLVVAVILIFVLMSRRKNRDKIMWKRKRKIN